MQYAFKLAVCSALALSVAASHVNANPRSIKIRTDGSTVEMDSRTNRIKDRTRQGSKTGELSALESTTATGVPEKHVLTFGTGDTTPYQIHAVTERGNHGNRIYCVISHFSYDDPIIYPNEPGKAHLHMFWGSTALNAFTTSDSILKEGLGSCEGGADYKVGAWMPALYNSRGEVVLPEETYIYYKVFGHPSMNYKMVREIPQGLSMLASSDTRNFGSGQIRAEFAEKDGRKSLAIAINFPSCVATDNGKISGNPILSFRNMPGNLATQVNSHVAYPGFGNEVGCPTSHPYRFATPSFIVWFDANQTGSQPYLSSDAVAGAPPLSTLHGDYMFGAAPSVNEAILRCVQESRECGFDLGDRWQLPDRFFGPAGQVYEHSVKLLDRTDRTPFGNALPPSRHHGHGGH
jgi:hypothetical protein